MDVASHLVDHGECRRIWCHICESPWSERYVGTVLSRDQNALGSICPRCLSGSPSDAAVWIGEYCLRLRQALDDVDECLSSPVYQHPFPTDFSGYHDQLRKIADMTARTRRVSVLFQIGKTELPAQFNRMRLNLLETWEESKRLIAEARSMLGAPPKVYSPRIDKLAEQALDHETSRASNLLELAGDLATLPDWPVTLSQLIAAEREQVSSRLRISMPADLFAIVDSRYLEFLSLAG
jgi:hypothetical protein